MEEYAYNGLGVHCTIEIPANTLIGVFWGQLYRRLPSNRRYSFEVTVPGYKKLYLGAENAGHRPILAFTNHSCRSNARHLLSGTRAGEPKLCFYSGEAIIPPFTELTIDYGPGYFNDNQEGIMACRCDVCAPAHID